MFVVKIIAIVLIVFFALTFGIYWFNLDTKLVKLIWPLFEKHYDKMPRDRRL